LWRLQRFGEAHTGCKLKSRFDQPILEVSFQSGEHVVTPTANWPDDHEHSDVAGDMNAGGGGGGSAGGLKRMVVAAGCS
jgi:hypothetical protein